MNRRPADRRADRGNDWPIIVFCSVLFSNGEDHHYDFVFALFIIAEEIHRNKQVNWRAGV